MPASEINIAAIDPVWSTVCSWDVGDAVHVWKSYISDQDDILNHFFSLLAEDEQLQSSRFLHGKDRVRFINRRGVLRILLGRYMDTDPSAIRFALGDNKKPMLGEAFPKLHFNISSSGNWVLVSVARSESGVDIERINYDFNFADVMTYSFSEPEIRSVHECPVPAEQFFSIWVRKEAIAKGTAKGLDDDLKNLPGLPGKHIVYDNFAPAKNWNVLSFNADGSHKACLSCQADISDICFLDFHPEKFR